MQFSQSEKRGFFILLAALAAVIISLIIRPLVIKRQSEKVDFGDFEKSISQYQDSIINDLDSNDFRYFDNNNRNRSFGRKINPFTFDPNTLSAEGWIKLGYSQKQAQAAEKYRQRGGVFRKKDDLKKLFFVDEDDFQILEPYIVIEKIPERERSYEHSTANTRRPAETKKIELNTADTSDLKELRGIGSGYAKRIVKYRERLGGFCKPEQLLEVYGFTPELYEKVAPNITIDGDELRKINLNTATIDQLKRHPYLDYYQAKAIVNYREKYGKFSTVNDLLKANLIYPETFEKIKPYLVVQ
ncbi:MAG: helix-hairpin-helix domain-containing protein [Bacteroidales bacterium]|nr:helix-hairpin-helix domain-containing protein [Bacteroidales bacterium]